MATKINKLYQAIILNYLHREWKHKECQGLNSLVLFAALNDYMDNLYTKTLPYIN